jgi:hypothetical protein
MLAAWRVLANILRHSMNGLIANSRDVTMSNSSSVFASVSAKSCNFSDLPCAAKKAIIWRWAFECFNDLFSEISAVIVCDAIETPFDISSDDWARMIEITESQYPDLYFRYFEAPTESVVEILLSRHEEISEYNDWSEYRAAYGCRDVTNYSKVDRWPVLALLGDDMIFDDGWHRLHSYINSGHETIPILEY